MKATTTTAARVCHFQAKEASSGIRTTRSRRGNRTVRISARGLHATRQEGGEIGGAHRPIGDRESAGLTHQMACHPGSAQLGQDEPPVAHDPVQPRVRHPPNSSSVENVFLPAAHQTFTPRVSRTRIQASMPESSRRSESNVNL